MISYALFPVLLKLSTNAPNHLIDKLLHAFHHDNEVVSAAVQVFDVPLTEVPAIQDEAYLFVLVSLCFLKHILDLLNIHHASRISFIKQRHAVFRIVGYGVIENRQPFVVFRMSIPVKDNVAIYFCPLNEARTGEHDLKIWKRIMAARSLVLQAGFRVGDSICGSGRFRVFHCMADMNSVVIGPDGSLYPCDHCPPDARFGDIWRNVTDEEVRKEFCRMDRTRGKCRKCPYMPVCTSFACCPVQDTHCREIRDLDLSYFVSRMGETDAAADDITIC